MDVDESIIAWYVLESIEVAIGMLAQCIEYNFFQPIPRLQQGHGGLRILLLKHFLQNVFLLILGVPIGVFGMLSEEHLAHARPILVQALSADLMRVDVMSTKSLHTEIVNEAVGLDWFYLGKDLSFGNWQGDEAEGDTESVAFEVAELDRVERSGEGANADFGVPVLATLLSD